MAKESNLHTRAVQQSLTPNISKFHEPIHEELDWALKAYTKDIPLKDKWHTLDLEELILNLIAHISARIFVGLPLCREPDWIRINKACTVNVFEVALVMRSVPKIFRPLYPLIARVIPGWWRLQENISTAKRLAIPMALEYQAAKENGELSKATSKNLLAWMVDAALTPTEASPATIAHRQVLLGIGSIYTTKLAILNICYDFCAYPQYVSELRDEVEHNLRQGEGVWNKAMLDKMVKLESFMCESQRMSPPNLIAFNRIVKEPLTLHDGLYLPPNTQIGVPAAHIQSDAANFVEPGKFDPWRYCRMRNAPREQQKHRFAMTDLTHMHFGHGKFACPGRALALADIKMTVAELLLMFDMRFVEGYKRPRNISVHEMVFPSCHTAIEMRRRGSLD